MANRNSSTALAAEATSNVDKNPIHTSFTWLEGSAKSDPNAIFSAHVVDVSRGARVITELIRSHMTIGATGERALMSENDLDALAGLAVSSLNALFKMAEVTVERFNELTTGDQP